MDLTTITAAYTAAKHAIEGSKAIIMAEGALEEKGKRAELLDMLINVQDKILELRERSFELQEENQQLRNELNANDEWKITTEGYDLITSKGGAHIYKSKNKPIHYACPKCFMEKRVYILNNGTCPNCRNSFLMEKIPSGRDSGLDDWMGM